MPSYAKTTTQHFVIAKPGIFWQNGMNWNSFFVECKSETIESESAPETEVPVIEIVPVRKGKMSDESILLYDQSSMCPYL